MFIIAATGDAADSDSQGGAFFGFMGVACALVFASSPKLKNPLKT